MQSPSRSFINSTQFISSPIQPSMPTSPILMQSPQSNNIQKPVSNESECRKICLDRFKYVLLVSVIIQYLLFMIFAIPLDHSYLNPLKWFREMFSIFLSPLSLLTVMYGISNLNLLLKEKVYYPTRIAKFVNRFSHEALTFFLNFFIGLFTARNFVRYLIDDFKVLTIKNEGKLVLNEYYSFLLFCGVFMRIYFHFKCRDSEHDQQITFPTVHQSKFVQIKREVITLIKSSFMKSLIPTLHFIACYIIFGSSFSFLLRKMFLLSSNEASFWNNFTILFNLRLLIYAYILSALILSNVELMKKIINIFATQPKQFAITSSSELTLTKALEINKFQITQHLAAQDLFLLADSSNDTRRKEFYSLSIPGGHPHNWKQLIQRTLIMIDNFTSELKTNVEYVAKNRSNISTNMNNFNVAMTKFYDQKRILRDANECNGIRSFLTSPVKGAEPIVEKRSKLLMSIKHTLLSNKFIAYLFGEQESGKLNFLLAQNSQIIIWIVQGISAIVSRSVKEDKYGIIQHDFKTILKSLLKLKSILDKVGAINAIAKDRNFIALKTALRRSLYRIVTEFSCFFDDMIIDPEDLRALHNFVTFKEL